MPNMNYGEKVRDAYSGYFATGQAVPQNGNADGDEGSLKIAKTMQSLRVVMAAKEPVTLANAKTITMKLKDCDTEDGVFNDVLGASISVTAAGAKTYAAGEEICSIPVPHDDEGGDFHKVNIATDDAAAGGSVDVFVEVLP